MLTKEHAEKIAAKLEAQIDRSRKAHDLAAVYYEGKVIAFFGIRRGSRKNAGHDHIPRSIYFSARKCLDLANCPVSKADWLASMKELGKLPTS
jgi:hypothetical protein